MNRWARMAVLGLIVSAAVVGPGTAVQAQASGERIHSYDVDVSIEHDGSLLVVERIDYDFDGAQHHGIVRDIPVRFTYDDRYDRVYRLNVLSVDGSPGTPDQYKVERQGTLLRIRIGDPNRTITGQHTYTITYRVGGALNGFADHDELYWNAVGTLWEVPIDKAVASVTAPARIGKIACFTGAYLSNLPCAELHRKGLTAIFRQSSLEPSEGLTVVVAFPRGVVPSPQPILEERWSLRRAFALTPLSGGLAGALLVLLLGWVGRLMWVTGRDRRYVGSAVDIAYGSRSGQEQTVPLFEHGAVPVEYAPPEEIRPGQMGTLIDEVANPLDVTATVVDLAVRGYLRIEEIPKKWMFGKPDWRLVKLKAGVGLLPYERRLFDGLFRDADEDGDESEELLTPVDGGEGAAAGPPDRNETLGEEGTTGGDEHDLARVRLSELRKHFAPRLKGVQDALYRDAVDRRWFAGRPDKIRQRWTGRGWLLFLAGAGFTWLAAAKSHLGLVPIPIAITGLILAWRAHNMPRRTSRGTGLVRRVFGFRTYIETAEREESRFAERANLFYQYLPYAIVFGLTEKWARAFAGLAELPPNSWYLGAHPFTVGLLTSSIDGFTVSAAGTISSTPGSSGSSGFGGGGFAGGGGGGGGGGSW